MTLEALRAYSHLPPAERPDSLSEAARTVLGIWRRRTEEHPYQFGHGRSFREGKWTATWYSALAVVETLGRYPQVWDGPDATRQDRAAMAELAATLAAYCIDPQGRVAPRSVFAGFATHDFGRRGQPSEFAAAQVLRALHRMRPLADDIDTIDVLTLASAKGGTGTPLPPR